MSKANGSFRSKKVYFSQVSNDALRDNNLSLKAKGLYALIESYITIENFILYKNTLRKNCSEGEAAFESAWIELKKTGYLLQYKQRVKSGAFSYEYELLDTNHTPETQGVVNPLGGKVGVYNKTDLNNTNLTNTIKNDNDNGSSSTDRTTSAYVNKDAVEAIKTYLNDYYKQRTGKKHPSLKPDQYKAVYASINGFMDENAIGYQEMVDMMVKFFNTKTIKSDWNINHFATEGIMMNRLYEID